MTRVRVKRTVDRTRGHNLTKKKRAKAAELAGRDKWAAKMQEKIKQSSAEVQEELARRAEKHATEFERKVQRAVQLMAG
jgi:predicted Zn-dependent protease